MKDSFYYFVMNALENWLGVIYRLSRRSVPRRALFRDDPVLRESGESNRNNRIKSAATHSMFIWTNNNHTALFRPYPMTRTTIDGYFRTN